MNTTNMDKQDDKQERVIPQTTISGVSDDVGVGQRYFGKFVC